MFFEWHAFWLWTFFQFLIADIFISPTFLWIFYFSLPLKLAVLFSRHLEVLFHYLLGSITSLEKLTIGFHIWPSCSFQSMSLKVILLSLISQISLLHAQLWLSFSFVFLEYTALLDCMTCCFLFITFIILYI